MVWLWPFSSIMSNLKVFFSPKDLTSFSVLNILNTTSSSSVRMCFERFSLVKYVFIPSKNSRTGERFGFVRFLEVEYLRKLPQSLSYVWMGAFKLRVNVARFTRSQEKSKVPFRIGFGVGSKGVPLIREGGN